MSSFAETYGKRRDELAAQIATIQKKSQPLRDQYEASRREHEKTIADLTAQIAEAETGLADLVSEHSMIARALSPNDINMKA